MLHDDWTIADVEAEIAKDDPTDGLHEVPIDVSMDPPDCAWAMSVCLRLSGHRDEQVRGNAILGFGHLARICGQLNEALVKPLVEAALVDASAIVRGQAEAAADDLRHFLGWQINRPPQKSVLWAPRPYAAE